MAGGCDLKEAPLFHYRIWPAGEGRSHSPVAYENSIIPFSAFHTGIVTLGINTILLVAKWKTDYQTLTSISVKTTSIVSARGWKEMHPPVNDDCPHSLIKCLSFCSPIVSNFSPEAMITCVIKRIRRMEVARSKVGWYPRRAWWGFCVSTMKAGLICVSKRGGSSPALPA